MIRYEPDCDTMEDCTPFAFMTTRIDGEWVKYEEAAKLEEELDHALASNRIKTENEELHRAEIERLKVALRLYGVHINDCPKNLLQPDCDWEQACTCGFSSVSNSGTIQQTKGE